MPVSIASAPDSERLGSSATSPCKQHHIVALLPQCMLWTEPKHRSVCGVHLRSIGYADSAGKDATSRVQACSRSHLAVFAVLILCGTGDLLVRLQLEVQVAAVPAGRKQHCKDVWHPSSCGHQQHASKHTHHLAHEKIRMMAMPWLTCRMA
jgi:hypothetical protein